MHKRERSPSFENTALYHVYNRGNRKQEIFHDSEDYAAFLNFLDCYLNAESKHRPDWIARHFDGAIDLVAYCLMPNHYHMLIRQNESGAISEFMRALSAKYSKYRNKKYETVGHTFQDKFKARRIRSDADLINLSEYIHTNPINLCSDIAKYKYSSLVHYTKPEKKPVWLKSEIVREIFTERFNTSAADFGDTYLKLVKARR